MSKKQNSPIFRALSELHPGLFRLKDPLPLAVGIRAEILAAYPAMPENRLNSFLSWYCGRYGYLKVCTEGATRFGLGGESGSVSPEQAAFGLKVLAGYDARKAAAQPAIDPAMMEAA